MGDTVTNIDTHEGWRWSQGLRREIPCSLPSSQSPVSFQYSCWLNTSVCQFIGNLECAAYRAVSHRTKMDLREKRSGLAQGMSQYLQFITYQVPKSVPNVLYSLCFLITPIYP